ncbi:MULTISPECIES: hypothetical protein [unclassified Mesorhizobium]|uniref:hypothetical protein n=1 Tax=unclassified Mesorhizobium TaxID=325217 RepID=UPI0010938044|nr:MULTISPECIES: hypothetical protein [unclassified Mesorhizobium]TGQ72906.1 hypothetical protein EN848_06150 [bacterium M00.F.Ca.ET.205.01.1.1]TGU53663.1 hypothetical protein EN795_10570 [bacterium M00.F.Ca.ET.152.01.1.1]TGV37161.1 hypothetical protein EN829_010595 [Mesorhizobium sp. M00.F.Ca.ET.186.01.1.1]TGV75496.1 hypothetical protein EN788_69635 [Mesorhizobium sp. M2D.F.Ca.ET.145.01.1.1]TGZ39470.1 hypothetical protein EN805_29420 [bacterium M00.F.Ca.ET.162.01.1.1]
MNSTRAVNTIRFRQPGRHLRRCWSTTLICIAGIRWDGTDSEPPDFTMLTTARDPASGRLKIAR